MPLSMLHKILYYCFFFLLIYALFFTPFSCLNDLCCVVIAVLRIPNNIGEIDIDLIMEINN